MNIKKIIMLILLLKISLLNSEIDISIKNYILPAVCGIYTTSQVLSIYQDYTLMKSNKQNKIFFGLKTSQSITKILLAVWITNYIINFNTKKFLKSLIYSTNIIKYWI